MKTSMKVVCLFTVVISIVVTYAWPYIKMDFADSAHYTEQDKREYEFYTPDLLKEMPRISSHYDFNYSNISGPEALVFSIIFYGTSDTRKIRSYLTTKGYGPQATCDVEAECWRTETSNDVVTLATLRSSKSVMVQIYSSPYTH